ncbi:MAG: hypothetical protein ACMUHB_07070 [Thermoplasmatota archaeon]
MAEEKQVPFPYSISKGLFTLLMVLGILLFVVWTVVMFIKSGRILDWGIYSICVVMVLMGLFGRWVYSIKEKQDS